MALRTTGFTVLDNLKQNNLNGRQILANLLSSETTKNFSVSETGGDLNVFRNNVNNVTNLRHFNRSTRGVDLEVGFVFGEFFGRQYFTVRLLVAGVQQPLSNRRTGDSLLGVGTKLSIDGSATDDSPGFEIGVEGYEGFDDSLSDKIHFFGFGFNAIGIPTEFFLDDSSPIGNPISEGITTNTKISAIFPQPAYAVSFTDNNELKVSVADDDRSSYTDGDVITKITLENDPNDLGLRGYFHLRQRYDDTAYGLDDSPFSLTTSRQSAIQVKIDDPNAEESLLTGRYLYDDSENVWFNAANSDNINNPSNSPLSLTDDRGYFFYDANSPNSESPHGFGYWAFGKTINAAKGISGPRVVLIGGNNNSPFIDDSPSEGFWDIGNDNSPSGWALPLESPDEEGAASLLEIVQKMRFRAPVGFRYSGKYTYNALRNVWEDEDSPTNAEFRKNSDGKWEFHYEGQNKFVASVATDHPWQGDWNGFEALSTTSDGATFDTTNVILPDEDTVIDITNGVVKDLTFDYKNNSKSFVIAGHSFTPGAGTGNQDDVINTFDTSAIVITRKNGVTRENFLFTGEYDAQLYGEGVELEGPIQKQDTYVTIFNNIEYWIGQAKSTIERTISRRESTELDFRSGTMAIDGVVRFRDTQNQVVEEDDVISADAPGLFLLSSDFEDSPISYKRVFSETSAIWEVNSGNNNIQLQNPGDGTNNITLVEVEQDIIFDEAINIDVDASTELTDVDDSPPSRDINGENRWNDVLNTLIDPNDVNTFTHRMILVVDEIDPDDGSIVQAEYAIAVIRGDDV